MLFSGLANLTRTLVGCECLNSSKRGSGSEKDISYCEWCNKIFMSVYIP